MKRIDFPQEHKTVGELLDEFNRIEKFIAFHIVSYVSPPPEKYGYVYNLMLHNSIIPFGAKLKLLLALVRETNGPKIVRDDFHKLVNLRNAFAHGYMAPRVRRRGGTSSTDSEETYLVVETLASDGSFIEVANEKAIEDFRELLKRTNAQLKALQKHLRKL